VHAQGAFGGKPQRFRHVQSDFHGYVAELLAKATNQNKLDQPVTTEDKQRLLEALQLWGGLDDSYRYVKGEFSSELRGYDKDPGGGLTGAPVILSRSGFRMFCAPGCGAISVRAASTIIR
jgi:monoamine oxidase